MIIKIILSFICTSLAAWALYGAIALEDPEARGVSLLTSIFLTSVAYYLLN